MALRKYTKPYFKPTQIIQNSRLGKGFFLFLLLFETITVDPIISENLHCTRIGRVFSKY